LVLMTVNRNLIYKPEMSIKGILSWVKHYP